jgi:ABC-type transport system involved in cytochrome bd biosynthesis fused ATPase/permease subunit
VNAISATDPPIISVEHLSKRYKKATTPAVDDISFEVHPGELLAFLGPNGAGKTTTISILTTTLAKTSGTVTIAGHDLDREATAVRRNIGIILGQAGIRRGGAASRGRGPGRDDRVLPGLHDRRHGAVRTGRPQPVGRMTTPA